ncbi:protein ZINC INDUCED FACILITATOR-LIKE 1-like [Pyrus ussuriensis x Pyrus communis]|uniref:Protein ZINC INDUCED FACILITATOR-LIKE 1-like n=1 Tax=Pyrus ussuriensis x Pyrus communis TaxID=2448454 RepID=A0A5N5GXS9_9ROSA|nr:protein ZINC INDUCED FACILITATOR-LIKE 1-like [Pyrus ussuriensis x Pyrus communis]KAB2634600.1 protein ZINC INDUCED FACILITATOR-LIKE 1-like [Pyrus ussuriensis x Pyrus communis]
MEANLILFQRSLRQQAHFAPELFNDKVDSAPHRRTPRLPLAVAHLALPRRCTPYQNSNQCTDNIIALSKPLFFDGPPSRSLLLKLLEPISKDMKTSKDPHPLCNEKDEGITKRKQVNILTYLSLGGRPFVFGLGFGLLIISSHPMLE